MRLTRHATERRTLRNLPVDILQLIRDYGEPVHSRGALSLMLDDATLDLIAEGDLRRRQSLSRYRGAYLIESRDGTVITAARRTRRHRR
ncbi:hypothetical protein [Sedimentitalea arenosa]|uniref:DUF4258 domain-containing protein n=1 Tax=Sedimentitalea arenosa TaxID=2798803 RepID=A0A8J7J788_9RHOB|nr:hypothetical protein [Arenibacterium arenosum]MBJ6372710.1 hypothetical protein [Arenibacterium arenosum]